MYVHLVPRVLTPAQRRLYHCLPVLGLITVKLSRHPAARATTNFMVIAQMKPGLNQPFQHFDNLRQVFLCLELILLPYISV